MVIGTVCIHLYQSVAQKVIMYSAYLGRDPQGYDTIRAPENRM